MIKANLEFIYFLVNLIFKRIIFYNYSRNYSNRNQESDNNNRQESNNNQQKNGCVLPEPPQGGRYKLGGCDNCNMHPGDTVPISSILNYTCNSNYILKGNTISVCVDNKWLEPPSCLSKSIIKTFTFFFLRKKSGKSV